MNLYCCNCKKTVTAPLVKGKTIFPDRVELFNMNLYKCPICGNYVPCYSNTTIPIGCIPTKAITYARIKVRHKIDECVSKGITKNGLLKLISTKVGHNFHLTQTKSVLECLNVWDIIDEIEKEL